MSDADTTCDAMEAKKKKATPMTVEEMVHMVTVLEREDYDGKIGNYTRPNTRKDVILDRVVMWLHQHFGVERFKDQLCKR